MAIERIKTGIDGFDEIICGGIPKGSCTLVSGSAGSGKTTFSLQFLYNGAKSGEAGIYVTFGESKEGLICCAREFGMNLDKLEKEGKFTVMEYMEIGNEIYLEEMGKLKKLIDELMVKKKTLDDAGGMVGDIEIQIMDLKNRIKEIEGMMIIGKSSISQHQREQTFFERLHKIISKNNSKRLVVDSLSAYTIYDDTRESLYRFVRRIGKLGVTTIIISEAVEDVGGAEKIAEYMVEGVIILSLDPTMDRRQIEVRKLRVTKHTLKPMEILIEDRGIKLK